MGDRETFYTMNSGLNRTWREFSLTDQRGLAYLRATFAAHQRYLIEAVRGDLSDLLHGKNC